MDRKELTNRPSDQVSLKQSKKMMWSYIQKKTQRKSRWYERLADFFRFNGFSLASVVAALLIVVMVSYNFNFPFSQPTVVHASFEMEANEKDDTGIESNTSFTLTASTELSTKVVEEVLKVEPSVDLDVQKIGEKAYEITPDEDLKPNQIYHFSIMSEVDGKPQEFSWVYQVKDTFKVMSTLPGDKTSHVDGSTGIDIRFSHEQFDFESIQNYFEIAPQVEGNFEKHRETLSFVPKEGLKPGTIYTVTLKKGLPLKGSDQVLANDYQFQFETGQAGSNEGGMTFQRKHYEVGENKPIGLSAYKAYGMEFTEPIRVNIYQFPSVESYLSILENQAKIPLWSHYGNAQLMDARDLKLIAEAEAIHDEINWQQYLYLPTTELEKGYYLFEIQNPDRKSQALVQVTDLSAYLDITETDTLVWVNDLKTGQAVPQTSIEIVNQEALGTTDEQGIARFKTPEALMVEDRATILKISAKDEVLIRYIDSNYGQELLRSHYWYSFSTDRPVYKETDVLNFWGFLKPKTDQVSTEDLTVTLSEGNEAVIEKQALELSKTGVFKGSFSFEHVPAGYYQLILSQGDNIVSRESFQIQNYVKPAYQISIDSKQEAVFAGDEMHFDIDTQFFDGTPVPNLDLLYTHDWESGDIKTNQQGELSMAIEAQPVEKPCGNENNYCINQQNFNLSLSPQGAEETDIHGESSVTVFNSKIALQSLAEVEEDEAKISLTAHEVDLEAYEETGDYLGQMVKNKIITGQVTELSWKKEETGEYYDFINKKVEKTYSYEQVRKLAGDFEVKTNADGKATHSLKINPESRYEILLTAEDGEGHKTYETVYVYGGMSDQYDFYNIHLLEAEGSTDQMIAYDIGDSVKAVFANGRSPLPETEEGKFLFFQSTNGLQETKVQKQSSYAFEFKQDDVPNVFVSGVWFTGDNYVVAENVIVPYNQDLKKLSVEVKADETSYEPGDEVELSVLVKDQKGQPVQAEVNLNLVDEAYYQVVYEGFEDPLNDLYRYNDDGDLYSSSSHDNPLFSMMGGDKGGCFVTGTKILMSDGSYKNIEDIESGDFIQTKKTPHSSEMVEAKVLNTVSHRVNGYLIFNDDLKVTPEHVLFVNGQFQLAGKVKVGDRMLNKNGGWVTIHAIQQVKQSAMVYNFEVENQHTYFANDFYVHNDKGGDGIRSDFEDNALYETVQTNTKGIGKIKFQLPDNITSWRVVAKAIDSQNLQAGMNSSSISVSLPLFADLIVNSEYSIKDEPLIKFRAYGDSLEHQDEVEFEVSSETLGLNQEVQGHAFEGAYVQLPSLTFGTHELTLKAASGGLNDALLKPIEVVVSRHTQKKVQFIEKVEATTSFQPSKDSPTQVTFVDGGRGQYYNDLMNLYWTQGDRLDQRLTSLGTQELFQTYFDQPTLTQKTFEPLTYQSSEGGLRLIPYAGPDLELTAVTLILDENPGRFNQVALKQYLYEVYQNKEANLEEIVFALGGLAVLNEPVLNSLELIQSDQNLTLKDKLIIALAFESLGAKDSAEKIYQDVVTEVLSDDELSEVAPLAAVLAASLNDEKASELWELAIKNQKTDQFLGLYHLAYTKHRLKFAQSQPVTFKFTKNGQSETVKLKDGQCHPALFLEGDDVKVEVLEGQLAATLQFSEVAEGQDFANTEGLEIARNYTVKNKAEEQFKEGDLVKVTLNVSASEVVEKGAFRITDILPSGLTPVTSAVSYESFGSEALNHPYQIDGQEVSFYWYPQKPDEFVDEGIVAYEEGIMDEAPHSDEPFAARESFSYLARVVNPGKFYADPAKIEWFENPEISSISEEEWVEILKGE